MKSLLKYKISIAMLFATILLIITLIPGIKVFAATKSYTTLTQAEQTELQQTLDNLVGFINQYQNFDGSSSSCHINQQACLEQFDQIVNNYNSAKQAILSGKYADYVKISDKNIADMNPTTDVQVYDGNSYISHGEMVQLQLSQQQGYSSANLPHLSGNNYLVASQGLFTKPFVETNGCPLDNAQTGNIFKATPTDDMKQQDDGKFLQLIKDTLVQVVGFITKILFAAQCPGNEGHGSGTVSANFSVVSQMYNMYMPLNITDNFIIMKLVSIAQWMGYLMAIGLIIFYGIMYTSGYENLDPVKFGIRMFFAMIAVYFLPYLMQDILNLNNMIVHNLSAITIQFDGSPKQVSAIFALTLKDFADSITSQDLLNNLFMLILVIVMIVLALQPIISLITWWYMRLLKIFFYAIIGPMIVILIGLPQTASKATKWIEDFIGETFQQVFIVFAAMMLSYLFSNLEEFSIMTNLGWTGKILTLYAALFFLGHAPQYGSQFIGAIKGPDISKQVTHGVKKGARFAKNTAIGAAMGAGMGLLGKQYSKGKGVQKAISSVANLAGRGTNKTAKVAGKGALALGKAGDNLTGGNVQKGISAATSATSHTVGGMKDWANRVKSGQQAASAVAKAVGTQAGVNAIDKAVTGLSMAKGGSGKTLTQRRAENRQKAYENQKSINESNEASKNHLIDARVNEAKQHDADLAKIKQEQEQAESAARFAKTRTAVKLDKLREDYKDKDKDKNAEKRVARQQLMNEKLQANAQKHKHELQKKEPSYQTTKEKIDKKVLNHVNKLDDAGKREFYRNKAIGERRRENKEIREKHGVKQTSVASNLPNVVKNGEGNYVAKKGVTRNITAPNDREEVQKKIEQKISSNAQRTGNMAHYEKRQSQLEKSKPIADEQGHYAIDKAIDRRHYREEKREYRKELKEERRLEIESGKKQRANRDSEQGQRQRKNLRDDFHL